MLTCAILLIMFGLMGLIESVTDSDLLPLETSTYEEDYIFRTNGPFERAEEFGLCMIYLLFLTGIGLSSTHNLVLNSKLRLISCLLGIYSVFATVTRGLWIALAVGFFGFMMIAKRKMILLLIVLTPILFVITTVIQSLVDENSNFYQQRLGNVRTIYARFATFKSALNMFADKPFLGVGFACYSEMYERNPERYLTYYKGEVSVPTAHNAFLGIMAETGVIGLIFFCGLIASAIRMAVALSRSTDTRQANFARAAYAIVFAFLADSIGHDMVHNIAYFGKLHYTLLGILSAYYDNMVYGFYNSTAPETLQLIDS